MVCFCSYQQITIPETPQLSVHLYTRQQVWIQISKACVEHVKLLILPNLHKA